MAQYKSSKSFMSNTGKYYPASCVIEEQEYHNLSFLHQIYFSKIDSVSNPQESTEFETVPDVPLPDYTPAQPSVEEVPTEDVGISKLNMDGISTLD